MAVYIPDKNRYDGTMKFRRCRNSGIVLPEISLGLWHNFGDNSSFTNCREMVHYAFDNGITHFDLANNYGPAPGASEEMFGRILKDSVLIPREELIVTTKAGHEMWDGPYGNGSSRKMLITSLNQSLTRMNLDYVDIFYSHRYDGVTPIEETMQALIDIVKSGKALYVGISKYPLDKAQMAYDYLKENNVRCLVYQGRYSMFNRDPENGIIEQAYNNGAGFVAFSPLAQGLLTDRYVHGIPSDSRISKPEGHLQREQLNEQVLDKIRSLTAVAQKRGQTLAEMALAWVLRDSKVSSVIIGASSVSQLKSNLKGVANLSFGKEEEMIIDDILNR